MKWFGGFLMGVGMGLILVGQWPTPEPARSQFLLTCDEDGKAIERVADQMDTHGNIVQLWTQDGNLVQLTDPTCVVRIVDHHHSR